VVIPQSYLDITLFGFIVSPRGAGMSQSSGGASVPAPDLFATSVLLFLGLRLLLLMTLPVEALFQYGDFQHYYNLALWSVPGQCPAGPAACWPLIDFWAEFPPVFPYLALALVRLLGGGGVPPFHVFAYALALVLLLADLGSLLLVRGIARRLYTPTTSGWIALVYALLPATLILSWWTFDGLTTFWMLLGLWALLERRDGLAALAIGAGVLTKLVPVLLLPAVWRARPLRRAAAVTAGALAVVAIVLAPFMVRSPAMAVASLRSQASKSSYATVWAMLDGNLQTAAGQPITGNFGPLADRFDASLATVPQHQPGRVPGLLSLLVTAVLFGLVWLQTRRSASRWTDQQTVQFFAFTWALFLLWSKGWSPQWQQMILPLVLLTLPSRAGLLLALLLSAVCFLEWPVLLSRGLASLYPLTIGLRTALILGWAVGLGRTLLPSGQLQRAQAPA
jgi:hypothetical protein